MNWCSSCGAQYDGRTHNCGYVTVTADRLRELEDRPRVSAEQAIREAREGVAQRLRSIG